MGTTLTRDSDFLFLGVQMVAIVNQVRQIISGFTGSSSSASITPPATTISSQSTRTTRTITSSPSTSITAAQLYGQCGGIGWTGPTTCSSGVCTAYSTYYAQCLPALE